MADTPEKIQPKSEVAVKTSGEPARARDYFSTLRNEIDRVFQEFDRAFWPLSWRTGLTDIDSFWRRQPAIQIPSVDIVEKDNAYEILADLPGLKQEDIDLKLSDDVLTIKAERQEEKEEKGKDFHVSERRFGLFQRSFQLPQHVDAEKIEAKFENGVLSVVLPKKPEAVAAERKIAINKK